jgi:tRNA (guanine-N(7)-)-methyltransferase
MPVRSTNPFEDINARVDTSKNAYIRRILDAQKEKTLPLAFGSAIKPFVGNWRQSIASFFGNSAPVLQPRLIVEIGCHYGHTLVDMASDHPDALFLGVDITYKRVVSTAERIVDAGLKNVFVILANAKGLGDLFSPGEVDGFVTFFPDPWTKKKQAHNRLYSSEFCATVKEALSGDGFLWLKTDEKTYFENACDHVAQAKFFETQALPVLGQKDYSSAFMRRFDKQQRPWQGRKWLKSNRIFLDSGCDIMGTRVVQ